MIWIFLLGAFFGVVGTLIWQEAYAWWCIVCRRDALHDLREWH